MTSDSGKKIQDSLLEHKIEITQEPMPVLWILATEVEAFCVGKDRPEPGIWWAVCKYKKIEIKEKDFKGFSN